MCKVVGKTLANVALTGTNPIQKTSFIENAVQMDTGKEEATR